MFGCCKVELFLSLNIKILWEIYQVSLVNIDSKKKVGGFIKKSKSQWRSKKPFFYYNHFYSRALKIVSWFCKTIQTCTTFKWPSIIIDSTFWTTSGLFMTWHLTVGSGNELSSKELLWRKQIYLVESRVNGSLLSSYQFHRCLTVIMMFSCS